MIERQSKLALKPVSYYKQALEITRKIKDHDEECEILKALGEAFKSSDRDLADSYYREALKTARELLGDYRKEMACLGALIRLHGRAGGGLTDRLKEEARSRLERLRMLEKLQLRACIVDFNNMVPAGFEEGMSYRVVVFTGEIPTELSPLAELPENIGKSCSVDILLNLVWSDAPKERLDPVGVVVDQKSLVEVQPLDSLTASDRNEETGENLPPSEREPTGPPDSSYDTSFDSAPLGAQDPHFLFSQGSLDRRTTEIGPESSFDLEVEIRGNGVACSSPKDVLKDIHRVGSTSLSFTIIPTRTGRLTLEIRCDAKGIPDTMMMALDVSDRKSADEASTPLPPGMPTSLDEDSVLIDGSPIDSAPDLFDAEFVGESDAKNPPGDYPPKLEVKLDVLEKILNEHRLWQNTDGKMGRRANLQGAVLKGAVLRAANLMWAHLEKCDLGGADLSDADLHGAHLEGCNLSKANLGWAKLIKAKLEAADLSAAMLNAARLDEADLTGAILVDASLEDAHLKYASLTKADLRNANLHKADLTMADLAGANIQGADMRNAVLRGTRFRGANLANVDMTGADLRESDLVR